MILILTCLSSRTPVRLRSSRWELWERWWRALQRPSVAVKMEAATARHRRPSCFQCGKRRERTTLKHEESLAPFLLAPQPVNADYLPSSLTKLLWKNSDKSSAQNLLTFLWIFPHASGENKCGKISSKRLKSGCSIANRSAFINVQLTRAVGVNTPAYQHICFVFELFSR